MLNTSYFQVNLITENEFQTVKIENLDFDVKKSFQF